MDFEPLLGATLWIACSLGFLSASAAVVRMLDERTVAVPGAAGHLALDIVIAWDTEELATYQLVPTIAEEVRAAAAHHRHELAAAAAAPWSEKYPEVETHILVTTDTPAQALVDRSADADLVVVGSRGLGSLRGALMGSVSAEVLRHAHSPVAVIRPTAS